MQNRLKIRSAIKDEAGPFMSVLKTRLTSDAGVNPSLFRKSTMMGCHLMTNCLACSAQAAAWGAWEISTWTVTGGRMVFVLSQVSAELAAKSQTLAIANMAG